MRNVLRLSTIVLMAVIFMALGCYAAEIVPGKNLLTGTTEPMTFDGLTELPSGIEGAALSESPFSYESGKVLVSTEKNKYASVNFAFDSALPRDRHYQVSFKIYQKADEGYGKDRSLWIMKNARAGWQIAHSIGGFVPNNAAGWMEHSVNVVTFGTLVNSGTNSVDENDVSKILIEWGNDSVEAATVNQKIYIDDVSIVPLYKITCLDENGEVYRTAYENITGNTFRPVVTNEDSEKYIIGWSLENDGTVDEEISVNHKDITLYAVYDNSLKISLSSDINLLCVEGEKTTISASASGRKGTDGISFSYSVEEGGEYVTLTDNKDGTATVASKAEGMSKIVYTASTGEKGEIYILSDYSGVSKAIKIIKEAADINVDAGTSEMQAVLFARVAGERKIAWETSDTNIATVKQGNDGKATLVSIGNGKVTVTAYDATNEEISSSFDVNISNQRQKYAVYDIRIQFWGASATSHGPAPNLQWFGSWGMAASSEDKDYVHRLVTLLEEEFYPSRVDFNIVATSAYDHTINNDTDPNKDYSGDPNFVQIINAVKTLQPNIIAVAQTGNTRSWTDENCLFNAYSQVFDKMYEVVPDTILISIYCGLEHKAFIERCFDRMTKRYEGTDKTFIPVHLQLVGHPEYFASEWLLLDPPQTGVAAHWGDKGMDEVARIHLNHLVPHIRSSIEPTYIYIPEGISISGTNRITTEAGTIKLTAVTNPSDASNDVIWSVDNEKLAVINEYGILTAINNGTVTVTATSKYNDEVVATHEVVITGQPAAYTVAYNSNTTDSVSGIPENDSYAKGEYTLSEKRPLRDCYTFAGWGLTPDATETATTVNVTENTTVYAIWEKTSGFEFDGTYDEFFGYVYGFDIKGGFHPEVIDGILTATCTMGEKVTFKSPKVDIVNSGTMTFALESGYYESGATVELTVNTENDSKKYVFPLASDKKTIYVADTSALSGNFTGFEIYVNAAPADASMFGIYIDYVRFGVQNVLDAAAGEFSVTDGITTVSSKSHKDASKVSTASEGGETVVVTLDNGFGVQIKNTAADNSIYLGTTGTGVNVTVTTLSFNGGRYTQTQGKVYTESDGFFMENSLVSDKLTSYDKASIRTVAPQGMRVLASVTNDLYTADGISKYGFIITRRDTLESGTIRDLVIDEEYISSKRVIYSANFDKADGKHIIYEVDAEKEFFTAALVNIPEDKASLETVLVFRPYIKLDDGKVIYGAKTERSLCDIAKSVVYDTGVDSEIKKEAKKILDICGIDYQKEVFLPADSLYS